MVAVEQRASDTAPASTRLRRWWDGRLGRALLVEAFVLLVLLTLYRLGRFLGREQVDAAFDHARDVLRFEEGIGIANERQLQRAALDHLPLVQVLNRYYATAHFPVTALFLVVAYVRAPAVYRQVRAILVAVTGTGLVLHIAYPLAPPRMLHGFVDTIARYGPSIYDRPGVEGVANQYAAMPSLHVGWALIVALGTYRMWHDWRRWIGTVHAVMTTVAVVITANHFWLDGIAAFFLVVGAVVALERRPWAHEPSYAVVTGPTR